MPTSVSAPSVTSVSFDKTAYNPGDKITATVTYVPGKSSVPGAPFSQTFTGSVLDSVTGLVGTLVQTFTVDASAVVSTDGSTVSAADSGSRTWVKVSDSGTVAVLTATA